MQCRPDDEEVHDTFPTERVEPTCCIRVAYLEAFGGRGDRVRIGAEPVVVGRASPGPDDGRPIRRSFGDAAAGAEEAEGADRCVGTVAERFGQARLRPALLGRRARDPDSPARMSRALRLALRL